jgi:hypothetical protein
LTRSTTAFTESSSRGDLALGHHHGDLRALVHRVQAAVDVLEVCVEVDLAETVLGAVVGDPAPGQQVVDLFFGLESVDQLLPQCVLREIAARGLDAFRQAVNARRQLLRRELARPGDVAEVALPDIVHPVQVGLLRFRRCGIEDVRLGRGLVFADPEQVHVDPKLVLQSLAVVLAITAEAFEQQPAHRVEVDLVGLRGEQVLVLVETLAERDHLLAGRAQLRQRAGDFADRGIAGERHAIHAQEHALDPLVAFRRVERAQKVAQLHFLRTVVAEHARQRAAGRIAAVLLHQLAFRRDHQGGAARHRARAIARGEQADEHQQQAEEHQVEDQPAGEIHRIPQAHEETGDRAAAAGFVHAGAPGIMATA